MRCRRVLVAVIALMAVGGFARAQTPPAVRSTPAGDKPNFSGDWSLNKELSDEPPVPDDRADQERQGGRRGGFGGFGGRGRYGGRGGYGGYGAPRGANQQSDEQRAIVPEANEESRAP